VSAEPLVISPVVTPAQREALERSSREWLGRALVDNELVLETGPYEAHVGFSNVCNMSCIMCWNGANPPAQKMDARLIARFAEQVGPLLSIITPYNGSEPLIVTWNEARAICEQYSIDLCLTTNTQFLDEQKFRELEGITETLFLSIDSHVREVFELIRPRSKPDRVFANLRSTATLARACGLECQVNVVFMVENGPLLPESVEYLADIGIEAVHVLQMLDVNRESGWSNPLLHFCADYIELIKQRCIEVARHSSIRLVWDVGGLEDYDFRGHPTPPKPRKSAYDHWDWRMRNHVPGVCRNVYDRFRIDTHGSVAACAFSAQQLELGNLADVGFSEMWNGLKAQDLRRAHYTWDYPSICASCRFKDPPAPRSQLPFAKDVTEGLGLQLDDVERSIAMRGPGHATRHDGPPVLRFVRPSHAFDRLFVMMALGGETSEVEAWEVDPSSPAGAVVDFEIPAAVWDSLRPNVGWWWAVFGFSSSTPGQAVRSSEIWCLIKHRPIARIENSGLRYPDEGHLAPIDLGSVDRPGFSSGARSGARPALAPLDPSTPWVRRAQRRETARVNGSRRD
jgi:radical SAM protein with 4Fe4S-binding SPASM domain